MAVLVEDTPHHPGHQFAERQGPIRHRETGIIAGDESPSHNQHQGGEGRDQRQPMPSTVVIHRGRLSPKFQGHLRGNKRRRPFQSTLSAPLGLKGSLSPSRKNPKSPIRWPLPTPAFPGFPIFHATPGLCSHPLEDHRSRRFRRRP